MAERVPVLLIEDDAPIRRLLRVAFSEGDFKLLEAENGRQGLRLVATDNPRLVLLDLGLPDMDGVEVIKELRQWSQVPIIVLSARESEQQKVSALDAGANDYLTKPFGVPELIARMRVALRVTHPLPARPVFEAGGVRIDFTSREVHKHGQPVHLTPLEFNLVAYMVRHAGAGADPSPDSHRGLGRRIRRSDPVPAGFYAKSSAQARGRPRPARDISDRNRGRLQTEGVALTT